jgi:hypothetical protein
MGYDTQIIRTPRYEALESPHKVLASDEQIHPGGPPTKQGRGPVGQSLVDNVLHRREFWLFLAPGRPTFSTGIPDTLSTLGLSGTPVPASARSSPSLRATYPGTGELPGRPMTSSARLACHAVTTGTSCVS